MNIQFLPEGKEKDNNCANKRNRAEKVEEFKLLYATWKQKKELLQTMKKKRVETLNDEIKRIDKTIHILEDMKKNIEERGERRIQRLIQIQKKKKRKEQKRKKKPLQITSEEWSRMNIVLQTLQKQIMGRVIPKTIANKIIKQVYDISQSLKDKQNTM